MTATRGVKRLAVGILALSVAAFAAVLLIPQLVPADHVRDTVRREIRAVTGLDPVVRGGAQVSFFPTAVVTFTDVVLGDDRTGAPALEAERLTAQLRTLPLVLGRTEIADVSLVRPRITIAFEDGGNSNWSGLIATLSQSQRPDAAGSERVLSFSEIRIADGTIVVRDRARGIDETMRDVALSLAWPSISKSFGATGRFVWRDQPIEASASLNDLFAALKGERSGLKLRLSGALLKLAFDGQMSSKPSLQIDGTLAADGGSLRDMLQWLGRRPLPEGGFGRFAVKAQTKLAGATMSLTGVNAELDGNVAEGVLTFVSNGRPTLQGTLAAEAVDLSPYISAIRLLRHNERDWSRTPIALDTLDAFDLDLRLSAAKVALVGATLGRTALAANLRNGRMTIAVGESHAFGGVIKGSIGLARAPAGADVKAQLQFSDVDLETCLSELFGIRRLEGKGRIALNLEGSGASVFAVTRTIEGEATLSARRGALAGINIEQFLRRLEQRPLSGGSELRSGRTPFEQLSIRLKLAQGTATVEEVQMEGAVVRLVVAGSASIPARELDLTGTASLIASDPAKIFALPFVVQGQWDDPIMLPDAESLIRHSRATAPLLDALRERTTRGAVRSAIERLTGGAATPPAAAPAPAGIPASQ